MFPFTIRKEEEGIAHTSNNKTTKLGTHSNKRTICLVLKHFSHLFNLEYSYPLVQIHCCCWLVEPLILSLQLVAILISLQVKQRIKWLMQIYQVLSKQMLIIHKSHYFAKSLEIVIIFSKLIKYGSKSAYVQHQAHIKVTTRCGKSINLSKNHTCQLNLLESKSTVHIRF